MTQSIHQALILNVLQQVSPDRLQRAVNALVENAASVMLTRTTDTEIRALVRNGEGHEYGVTLTETSIFCSCRDALYRGRACKHATVLALTVLRTVPKEKESIRTIHLMSQEGMALCGVPRPPHVWKWPYWPETTWKGCGAIRGLKTMEDLHRPRSGSQHYLPHLWRAGLRRAED